MTITSEFVGCDGVAGKVLDILITNSGCGYTVHLKLRLKLRKDILDLIATTGISTTGSVKLVTITNGGSGYIGSPSVGISTPKHVGQLRSHSCSPSVLVGVSVPLLNQCWVF